MNFAPCMPDSSDVSSADPVPSNLDYTLGLPGGAYCLSMARKTVDRLLRAHDLADMAELAVLTTSELLTNAYLFTPGKPTSLSIRWRFGVLRLTVFDEHPRHPRNVRDACQARRRAALSTLDAALAACESLCCGLDEVGGPLAGNKMWVAFSRKTARNYERL
ncbi:ATP-binding protein [Streptomyces sp. NPDC020379]|uniref:ATP-binding protein n=1 Tax=Streptomyces sp. NPDC020379 TaxID=3365071 RepID=UPI00379BB325